MFVPNYATGRSLFKMGQYAEAVSHFRGLTRYSINAQAMLAKCYQYGLGVPKDLYHARELYRYAKKGDFGKILKDSWAERELNRLEPMELSAGYGDRVEFDDFACGRVVVRLYNGPISILFKDDHVECKSYSGMPYDFVVQNILELHNERESNRAFYKSPLCVDDGLVIDYDHFHFRVERYSGSKYECCKDGDRFTLLVPQNVDFSKIVAKETVIRYGRRAVKIAAKEYLPKRLAELSQKSGLNYRRCSIVGTRNYLGIYYCKSKDIELQYHLIKCSDKFIDAVLMHELCHSLHGNHGEKFYEAMRHYAGEELYRIDRCSNETFPIDL